MSHYWSSSRAIHTALHAGLLIGLFIFGCLPSTLENPTSLYGNTLAPCLNSSLAVSQLTVLSTVAMAEEGSEAATSPIRSYRRPHAPLLCFSCRDSRGNKGCSYEATSGRCRAALTWSRTEGRCTWAGGSAAGLQDCWAVPWGPLSCADPVHHLWRRINFIIISE